MRYIVIAMHRGSGSDNKREGYFKIVDAESPSDAKKIGVEQLMLDGKMPAGKSIQENMNMVKVEQYRGNF